MTRGNPSLLFFKYSGRIRAVLSGGDERGGDILSRHLELATGPEVRKSCAAILYIQRPKAQESGDESGRISASPRRYRAQGSQLIAGS